MPLHWAPPTVPCPFEECGHVCVVPAQGRPADLKSCLKNVEFVSRGEEYKPASWESTVSNTESCTSSTDPHTPSSSGHSEADGGGFAEPFSVAGFFRMLRKVPAQGEVQQGAPPTAGHLRGISEAELSAFEEQVAALAAVMRSAATGSRQSSLSEKAVAMEAAREQWEGQARSLWEAQQVRGRGEVREPTAA